MRHWRRLFHLAYGILRRAEDAEDAAQEAWMRIWDKMDSWRGDAPAAAWMSRIAANAALDRLRRRRDGAFLPEPIEDHEETLAGASTPPDVAADDHRFALALDRARGGLSPQQQAVFQQKAVEGRDFAEIAATLGCGESSARQHYFRALKKLRGALAPWNEA